MCLHVVLCTRNHESLTRWVIAVRCAFITTIIPGFGSQNWQHETLVILLRSLCLYVISLISQGSFGIYQIDGLVQERRNSIANALELRLSCTNPSIWYYQAEHDDVMTWKHMWFPSYKATNAKRYFLVVVSLNIEWSVDLSVIWNAMMLMCHPSNAI